MTDIPIPKKQLQTNKLIANQQLINELKDLIESTKIKIAGSVNAALTLMYWEVGKKINDDILQNARADYGKEIVATLSQQLQQSYGRGFEERI